MNRVAHSKESDSHKVKKKISLLPIFKTDLACYNRCFRSEKSYNKGFGAACKCIHPINSELGIIKLAKGFQVEEITLTEHQQN